jgi:hypothetical protein
VVWVTIEVTYSVVDAEVAELVIVEGILTLATDD